LSGVLALNSADLGAIGAVAPQLQADLAISHTQLGLLVTASSGMGALASVPFGGLADRLARVRLLIAMIVMWSVALGVAAVAPSYGWLLLSRLILGGAGAAAGPLLSSLLGDLFPADERAWILGRILAGETIGAGAGLLAGGDIAAVLSWRYAFWLLAAVGIGLAWAIRWGLPEPARGGLSQLRPGATEVPYARPARLFGGGESHKRRPGSELSVPQAMIALVRIRTVWILIVASAVGYFFFAGVSTFAVVFAERLFRIDVTELTALLPVIGAGAVAGTLLGGRLADHLLARGNQTARVTVPAAAYSSAAVLFVPGLLVTEIGVALPFFTVAAALLAAANPPLDAARLDLVPPELWGRAESARTVLRLTAQAVAPLCFGVTADMLVPSAPDGRAGVRNSFLITLVPLLANGIIVLAARRTYPRDVNAVGNWAEHPPDA
jgi:predicted MFS family arabinose efflux permease